MLPVILQEVNISTREKRDHVIFSRKQYDIFRTKRDFIHIIYYRCRIG